MKIFIKDTSGSSYQCDVEPSTTAGEIATDFFESMDWLQQDAHGSGQRPVVEFLNPETGKYIRLRQDQTLGDAGITDSSVLQIFPEAIAGCFPANMRVAMSNGQSKLISAIKAGDSLLTAIPKEKNIITSQSIVQEITKKKVHNIFCINENLFTTGDQTLLCKGTLKKVYDLKPGDTLLNDELTEVVVETITSKVFAQPQNVYNIILENSSQFFLYKASAEEIQLPKEWM